MEIGSLEVVYKTPELERLERDVIEAAKAEMEASDEYVKGITKKGWERCVETRVKRQAAVRALINFESQQIKK